MTLEQLNAKYSLVNRQIPFEIIDFFNANSLTIQNLDEKKDTDTLTTKLCLLSDFAYAVAQSGQSTQAIPYLKDSIKLQELHPTFLENKMKSKNYEFLVFELGHALYKTGNIGDSKVVFEKLIHIAPNNEGYRNWALRASNHWRYKIRNYVYLTFTIWGSINVWFGKGFIHPFEEINWILGLTLFVGWLTLEVVNWLTRRKYRSKHFA